MRKGEDSLLDEQAYSPGLSNKKKASMIMSAMAWAQAVLVRRLMLEAMRTTEMGTGLTHQGGESSFW
jgi:hypothetical protein